MVIDMKSISIDIETFSSTDLRKCGVYKYAESSDFEILLFAYSADGGEVQVIDLAGGESLPEEIYAALSDPTIIKWAFNAQFERICISRWLGLPAREYLDPESWRCSMIWSATMGLPLSLEGVGSKYSVLKIRNSKKVVLSFAIFVNPVNRQPLMTNEPETFHNTHRKMGCFQSV